MKRLTSRFFALALLTGSLCAGEPNTLTPEESAAGWKLLFDGTSTAGWHALGKTAFPTKGWAVENGELRHAAAGGGGDILTSEVFTNFELTWQWKISEAGNSGVKYNLPNPDKGVGFEYQLLDDEKHPDGIKGGTLHQTAGLYDLIAPAPEKVVKPVGQWNQSRLLVEANHVEHWVNGVKTVSFDFGSPALSEAIARSKYKSVERFGVKTSSPILLQDHGDAVAFRDLKIRILPAK